MSSIRWMIACSIIALATVFNATAAEAGAEYTAQKLQELIKQLGDENYDSRKNAEKELTKVGAKAKDALTAAAASPDAQVKATAKRLLGRLKFSTLGAINYFDVFPQETFVAARLTNIADTLLKGEATFLAKFINAKHFDPLRQKLQEEMENKPEEKKLFDLWSGRFRGQAAAGMWEFNFVAENGIKAAVIAEITDGDPVTVYNDVLALANEPGEKLSHNDVEITEMPMQRGTFALAGNHLILATNTDAIKVVIDALGNAAPKGLNQEPSFVKAKASLGARSDAVVTVNIGAILTTFGMMMPPGSDDVLATSGIKDIKMMVYNTAISGESFEDRFVALMDGQVKGFRLAGQIPPDAPAPLEAFATVPANAVGAQTGYMDGSKLSGALKDYVEALKKIGDAKNEAMGQPASPDIAVVITQLEAATGVKFDDVLANMKGTVAYWVVLGPPPSVVAPDIGAMVTCVDAEKAKATAATLAAAVNKGTGKAAIKEVAWKTRTIYQLDIATLNPTMPKQFPYTQPCFVADGNRVYIGSSSQSLQKHLNNVDAKAPGLLTNPDFVKAMGTLKPDERRGQIGYIDLKSLATLGGIIGLPLLTAQAPDEGFKEFLGTLPAPAELFKDMPPLIFSSNDRGDRQEMIIRAPLPPLPILVAFAWTCWTWR